MNTRRDNDRKTLGRVAIQDHERVTHDAAAWVASMRTDVAALLESFRRQHGVRATSRDREVLDHVTKWVDTLRLDMAELLPQWRRQRLETAQQDSVARGEFLSGVEDWVTDVQEALHEMLQAYRDQHLSQSADAAGTRQDQMASLSAWSSDFRAKIGELITTISASRQDRGQEHADERRKQVDHLKVSLGELLATMAQSRETGGQQASEIRLGTLQDLSLQVRTIQSDTETMLQTCRKQRLAQAAQDGLARRAFVDRLRQDVALLRGGDQRSTSPKATSPKATSPKVKSRNAARLASPILPTVVTPDDSTNTQPAWSRPVPNVSLTSTQPLATTSKPAREKSPGSSLGRSRTPATGSGRTSTRLARNK